MQNIQSFSSIFPNRSFKLGSICNKTWNQYRKKLQEVLCFSFDIFILKNLKFIDDFRYIQTKNVHLSQKRKFDDKNLEAEQGLF
jgi:hypothetical protein